MLKANKRTLIITSLVTILPMLIGVFFWKRLPDVMATHFGLNNEPDGFSSKAFTVFGIPLILLAIEWVCVLVTSHDPKKQNINPKLFSFVVWIVPIVSIIVTAIIYPYNLGYRMNVSFWGELLVGVMLVVVGNYLPKARQNYTIGIRVPWTLDNEENWNRTHRFGGFLWVIGGILMIVVALTGKVQAAWLIGVIIVITVIPCIYSFLLHTKKGL